MSPPARPPESAAGADGRAPAPGALAGVGVDAELVARFERHAARGRPWRHVYSPREAEHLAVQPRAALAFCAAFCAKEALYKALGGRYPFQECELLHPPGDAAAALVLSPGLRARHGVGAALVRFPEGPWTGRGECVAEVRLFGDAAAGAVRSRLETVAIGAAASERARIEDEHFDAAETADLRGRRVQSLAGALALKRALAGLWGALGGGAAAARPRDFRLAHAASGAPRLIAAPPGVVVARVRVSIAHTREWAYGLAAVG